VLEPCKCNDDERCVNGKCEPIPKEVVVKSEEKPEQAAPVQPESAPVQNVTEEKSLGVGQAAGFLNIDSTTWRNLLWIIAGVLAVALIIKMMSGSKKGSGRRINHSELEKYIDVRRRSSR